MAGFYTFIFACCVAIVCFFLYLHMEKTDFFLHYTQLGEEKLSEKEGEGKRLTLALVREIVRKCWGFLAAVILLGISTNMITPSATALVQPVDPSGSEWHETYFVQAN